MKIVQVHNFYQQAGGEDVVVKIELDMLEAAGHEVVPYYCFNKEVGDYSLLKKFKLLKGLHFNPDSFESCKTFLLKHQPDVCHVHNTFHIISPAIYSACNALGIPVVQTLHNYRSICANGMFTRKGKPCEDCLNKSAYSAVPKKCYRNSRLQTLAVARMIEKNKNENIWNKSIDATICLTKFAKSKFVEAGFTESKLHIKPNFLKPVIEQKDKEDYVVFVGRLDCIKGAHLLPEIAKDLKLPIHVIGDGELKSVIEQSENIFYLGTKPHQDVLSHIQKARVLILPSIVYEGMPMALLEAFALKTPIVASNMGAMASLIEDRLTGILFKPNDAEDAADKINLLLDDMELTQSISENAFEEYQQKYTEEANLEALVSIYQSVLRV